jgi:hypothetical protein
VALVSKARTGFSLARELRWVVKVFMRFPRLFQAFIQWALPDLAAHIDFQFFELVNKERFDFQRRESNCK